MSAKNRKLGEILIDSGVINSTQLEEALELSAQNGKILGEALMELGYVDEKTLFKGLEYLYHVPYIDLNEIIIDKEATSMITEALAKKHELIPIKKDKKVLTIAMADPLNFYAIDDVKNASGLEPTVVLSRKKTF